MSWYSAEELSTWKTAWRKGCHDTLPKKGCLDTQRKKRGVTLSENSLYTHPNVVFWPSTGPKMPSKVMHRKEVTHSNGSYERKSRGRKLADEMGRGKKFPLYTHRLMHRKRVTCELHDSYFRLMTIQYAIPKIE